MPEIFQYDFMLRAFGAGLLIAVLAPVIGTFLVVRRYSLLADTLSHVSLVGVATGLLLNFNPVLGAVSAASLAAIGMEKLRERTKILSEAILALFLSGSLALALIILSFSTGLNAGIFSYLFGSIATVTAADIRIMAIAGIIVLTATLSLFKQFFLISHDEEYATVSGLPVKILNLILMLLAAVTVSLSMRIVGVLLVGALMVIPVLTAMQSGKGFTRTLLLAVGYSLLSVAGGLFAAFYLNLPSGAAIVALALLLFGASLLSFRKRQV